MRFSVGERLASTVCETEVIVVRTVNEDVDLRCGGARMTRVGSSDAHASELAGSAAADGTLLGKRYATAGIELLCTKAGHGALSIGDDRLEVRQPKTLPSSD